MKFLFASDSFKGSLTSQRSAQLLEQAARQVFPQVECASVAVADGGEGTVEAVVGAVGGRMHTVTVQGPLGAPVSAAWGQLGEDRAILEMAAASGLPLLRPEERDPEKTSTYGTGQLIRAALEQGCTDITIAIGGSATNDGGTGCLEALGVRFLDAQGQALHGCGASLEKIAWIDTSGLLPLAAKARFTVMCDVNNPLCGAQGATMVYGAQKGADPAMLQRLEQGMCCYRQVLEQTFGTDAGEWPGAGAAGGLGVALMLFLQAQRRSGIESVLDLIGFDQRLEGVSLVVTGEGRTDGQSACGKVLHGVGERCKRCGVPAVALVGGLGAGAEDIFAHGIESLFTTVNGPMPLETALANAEELYYSAAVRMFRLLRVGMRLV